MVPHLHPRPSPSFKRDDRQVVTTQGLVHDYNYLQSGSCRSVCILCYESVTLLTPDCRGWDQTGSNGANLSFPQVFHIDTDPTKDPHASRNQWIVGIINSGCAYHDLVMFVISCLLYIALTLALPSLAVGLQTLLIIISVVVGHFSSAVFFAF